MDRSEPLSEAVTAVEPSTTAQVNRNLDGADITVSPTSADANVVARFEFDAINGIHGTRVLLIEWDCSPNEPPADKCSVTWEGKTRVLSVHDCESTHIRRLLFLLPPTAAVPPAISIERPGFPILHGKPLPAIFPGSEPGRRGVLHTLFATLSLAQVELEIAREASGNAESVGIEMALKEKEFLQDYFGVGAQKKASCSKPVLQALATTTSPPSHQSAQSPLSLRMSEKLKGLKLATSPEGLAAAASGM